MYFITFSRPIFDEPGWQPITDGQANRSSVVFCGTPIVRAFYYQHISYIFYQIERWFKQQIDYIRRCRFQYVR